MTLLSRGKFELHYSASGTGNAILMLHANPFDRRLWRFQEEEFRSDYRVICPDFRAYGLSSKLEIPYGVEALLDDISAILDAEHVDHAVLLGCSVGSRLSLYFSLAQSQRVSALVLVGGNSQISPRIGKRMQGFRADKIAYHRAYLRELVAPEFANSRKGRELLAEFADTSASLSVVALENFFLAANTFDCTDLLHTLDMPTLVINGEFDHSMGVGRRTAALIPNAQHIVIPDAGHACCLEKPEHFNKILRSFLDRHGL